MLVPVYGWGPRGQRVRDAVATRHWETVSFIGTLTAAGIGDAAMSYPGAIDRVAFDAFVTQQLVPKLRPGQVVVLDNHKVHKSPAARQAIEAAGCRLCFLPPDSPDFNPIEQMFAKMKHVLRRQRPGTVDQVITATGTAMAAITPQDAHNYFVAAGYHPHGHPL